MKHGYWKQITIPQKFYELDGSSEEFFTEKTVCSVCGEDVLYNWYGQYAYSEYCPHCGSIMDAEPEEN